MFHQTLAKHLKLLEREGLLDILDGGHIPAGAEIESTIEGDFCRARVIVLLVSVDFVNDDLWWRILDRAVKAAHLVPVRVRQVSLDNTPLAQRQLLPRNSVLALNALSPAEQEEEWSKIANEIREIVQKIRLSDAAHVGVASTLEDVQAQKDSAHRLMYRGRGTDALSELRVALEKLEVLSKSDSGNVSLKKERAHLHDRIGQCEYAQGRFEAARAAFDLAFEIRIDLCGEHDDGGTRHDVTTSRFWRAHLAFIRGDLAQARDEQQEGMSVCEKLLAQDADDLKAGRAFVVLQTDLGTTLWELGDQAEAERHLRGSLERVRKLAERHPDNRQLQRDVSVALFRLADFLTARGEIELAARLCKESIRMCRVLSEWDPGNVQWWRHLATARISMGDVRLLQGDMALARGDYEFAVGTMGVLAMQERENLLGQRQYAISERKLGHLAYRAGGYQESIEAYQRAASAMAPVSNQGVSARWRREFDEIRDEMGRARDPAG